MRPTELKAKLRKNAVTIGSWLTLADTAVAEIMSASGFDWLTIDMEHSAITMQGAQELIRVIELAGIAPLVRTSENNPVIIKRVMDAGAHGVIVPMVNTKQEAEAAVAAVKYPPKGRRGVGLARAQGYGVSFADYAKWLATDSVVIVQIEHIQAVENIDEILGVDGVDGLIVGPYDLSASLSKPGQFDIPEMISAMQRVLESAAARDKPAGVHVIPPDADQVRERLEQGYRFIAFSLDTLFVATCRDMVGSIRGGF